MARMAEVIRGWLGWCPHARAVRMAPAGLAVPSATLHSSRPDGSGGGQGRIGRGITIALGSIRILIQNRRLLWFSFLAGLVMAFNLVSNVYIGILSGTNLFPGTGLITPATVLLPKGSILWTFLTFSVAFVNAVLTYYILAGLIACVSGTFSGKRTTLRESFALAGTRIRSLARWAVIGACIGTALSFVMGSPPSDILISFASMAGIFAFFVLTMFVVPAIVLNNEPLVPAVATSLAVCRKIWAELIVSFGVFVGIAFAIAMTSLVPMIAVIFTTNGSTSGSLAGAIVILYMLVLLFLGVIGNTVSGIATLGLYTCAKSDTLPPAFSETSIAGVDG